MSSLTARRAATLATFLKSPANLWLAVRVLAWAAALPVFKRVVPLPRLVRFMSAGQRATARREMRAAVARLDGGIYRSRTDGRCLERSLVVYRFLSRYGFCPSLVTGLRRTETGWVGHAWVVVDGVPFNEPQAAVGDFTPLVTFDELGRMRSEPRAERAEVEA